MTLFRGLLYTQGSLARGGLAEGSVRSIRKRHEKCHETVGYSPGGLTSIRKVSTLPNRGGQGGAGGRRGAGASPLGAFLCFQYGPGKGFSFCSLRESFRWTNSLRRGEAPSGEMRGKAMQAGDSLKPAHPSSTASALCACSIFSPAPTLLTGDPFPTCL